MAVGLKLRVVVWMLPPVAPVVAAVMPSAEPRPSVAPAASVKELPLST